MSRPHFTPGPRKPATTKQHMSRTVNWGLFSVEGAIANIGNLRYRLARMRADPQAALTEAETYELRKAEHNLILADMAMETARSQLRMFNILRGKK